MNGKRIDWRVVLIFAVGLGLRCVNLSSRSIQYDDAFSIFLAEKDLQTIISGTAADTMPPLYYYLLHLWLLVSHDLGWLRLLSVGLSLVGVYFIFRIVENRAGRNAGLYAAFLASISPLQIYHAQDLRMYALLAAAQMGYFYFFLRVIEGAGASWKSWMGFIGLGVLAMYSHNLAIFGLVVPDLILLARRDWMKLSGLIKAQAVIGLLAFPWLLMVPGQVEKIQRAFWTPQPGLMEIIQAAIVMTTNLPLDGNWLMVGAFISIALIILIGYELIRKRIKEAGYLLWMFLVPPILLFIVSYLMRPVFVPRGFLVAIMAYLGIAGIVVARTSNRWVKGLLVGGFVIAAVIALPYQLRFEEFPRSAFSKLTREIQKNIQPDEVVVHDNKLSYFPAHYYAPELNQRFVADESGSPNDTYAPASQQAIGLIPSSTLEEAVGKAGGVYFVTFQKTIEEYQAAGLMEHLKVSLLSSMMKLRNQEAVGDLRIYYFK